MKERAGIQSVEVGFGLLEVLSKAAGPLMLRDLAAAAGMSAAKAHRYLVSFQRLQLVVQDASSTRYDLGPASLKLGLASLSRLDAVKLARERITPLMEQVGHTLALAVWGNHGPTIVHWEESPQAVTVNLRLGDVMPLLSSATGRCFAAFLSRDAADDAALLGADFQVDLLCLELDDRLADLDPIAGFLEPPRDARLDDRFTQLWNDNIRHIPQELACVGDVG